MWFSGPVRRGPEAGREPTPRLGFDLKPGLRVGLYGGSFDPAHEGHAHVARTALTRLNLDRVIWLVSTRNPLKTRRDPADLRARMTEARGRARGPSMIVSDVERRLGTRYTLDTLHALKARFPGVRFVWIMGGDNLATFQFWRGWAEIFRIVPVAVIARPGAWPRAAFSPAAQRFARYRLPLSAASRLAMTDPPAWIYLPAPLKAVSSTALRGREKRDESSVDNCD